MQILQGADSDPVPTPRCTDSKYTDSDFVRIPQHTELGNTGLKYTD